LQPDGTNHFKVSTEFIVSNILGCKPLAAADPFFSSILFCDHYKLEQTNETEPKLEYCLFRDVSTKESIYFFFPFIFVMYMFDRAAGKNSKRHFDYLLFPRF